MHGCRGRDVNCACVLEGQNSEKSRQSPSVAAPPWRNRRRDVNETWHITWSWWVIDSTKFRFDRFRWFCSARGRKNGVLYTSRMQSLTQSRALPARDGNMIAAFQKRKLDTLRSWQRKRVLLCLQSAYDILKFGMTISLYFKLQDYDKLCLYINISNSYQLSRLGRPICVVDPRHSFSFIVTVLNCFPGHLHVSPY